jgi:hypothetical protein
MYLTTLDSVSLPIFDISNNDLIAPRIIVIIVILIGIIAVLFSTRLIFQFSAARRLLFRLRKEPELFSLDHIGLAQFAAKSSTKGSIARAVRNLDSCKSPADVRELVGHVAIREESRFAAVFLNFAVGSVLILGLMGTFIAFAELVSNSDLRGDALQQGIRNVLAHLNIAFSASIAGVGVSILLLFITTILVRPKRQLLLADLEELLVSAHLDSVRMNIAAMEGTESGDLFETLRKLSGNLAMAVDAIRSVAERFETISTSTPEAIAATLESVKEEISSGSVRYAELVATASATKEAVEGISAEAAKVLGQMLTEHGARQLEVYAKAEQFSQELLNKITLKDAERLDLFSQGISVVADKVSDLALGWQSNSEELVTAFKDERIAYIDQLQLVGQQSLANFEACAIKSEVAIENISARMTESCEKVATSAIMRLKDACQAIIVDWQQSTEIAKRHNETVGNTLKIIENRLEPLSASLADLQSAATEVFTEARKAVTSIDDIPTKLDDIIAIHTSGADVLTKEADKMSYTIQVLSEDANGVFTKTADKLNRLSTQLDKLIEIGKKSGFDMDVSRGNKIISWFKKLGSNK